MKSLASACVASIIITAVCTKAEAGIEVKGQVQAGFEMEVKSEVPGKVKKLHVELGDIVKKGDLLADITAEETLLNVRVLAERNGIILTLPIIEKQWVRSAIQPGGATTLMVIADLSKLLIETHIRKEEVAKLKLKQVVTITSDAIPGTSCQGEISFIAPISTPKDRVNGFSVQATIEKPDPRLRPGMTVILTVP